jgi:uncharacterized protein YeaO (DUF488 family)
LIKTASIYSPPSGDGSLRVLVTRYWPRGVRKEAQDSWFPELGPQRALIKEYKSGAIGWDEFRERYLAEYSSPEKKAKLKELRALVRDAEGDVTLLCICAEEAQCHRSLLKQLLTGKLKPR